jgi:hypothetical protein
LSFFVYLGLFYTKKLAATESVYYLNKVMMRYLIFLAVFFTTSCSEHHKQQSTNQNVEIDTAKLFDPKPAEGKEPEHMNVFNNCLMLDSDSMAIVLNQQKHKLANFNEVKAFIKVNLEGISRQKFYIIYANGTSFESIINLLDIVKAAKIENFKVITLQSLFTLNEPM